MRSGVLLSDPKPSAVNGGVNARGMTPDRGGNPLVRLGELTTSMHCRKSPGAPNMKTPQPRSRRQFLGGTLAAGALAAVLHPLPPPADEARAAEPKPREFPRKIKLGIIGCGGRGPWLGGLFNKHGGYELHVPADYFTDNADKAGDELGVDKARRFSGLPRLQSPARKRRRGRGGRQRPAFPSPNTHTRPSSGAVTSTPAQPVAIDVPVVLKVQAAGQTRDAEEAWRPGG